MPTLELNDNEMRVLKAALNNHIALLMGRVDKAVGDTLNPDLRRDRHLSDGEVSAALQDAEAIAAMLTGVPNGGPSIGNPKVNNDARVARRLVATLEDDELALRLYNRDGTPK